jgi:cytochrome P450
MDGRPQSRGHARARAFDVLRLGAKLAAGALRGRNADPGSTVRDWARDLTERDGGVDVDIDVLGRNLELVTDRDSSERVLLGRPGLDGFEAGDIKTRAMAFLAPGALTIASADAWLRLRPYNEQVLGTGHPHQFAQSILENVRAAFARRVSDIDEVRAAMGRAMVKIVVGDVPSGQPDPAADVTALFAAVESPLRRRLLAFMYLRRRKRLYLLLARKWEQAGDGNVDRTLVVLGRRMAPDVDRTVLLQQIPHWMFTFTGSGTDLLTRTLATVTSRADVHARVLEEIRSAGPTDRADTVGRLAYLEACILETGRLFPPVTRTYHKRRNGGGAGRREIVHYFPLLQRDDRLGPTVHEFRPERWLAPELDPPAAASNLFLRGPRACPGMDIILFVCKAAAARQVGELGLSARQDRLARDPLPVSFPKLDARFTVSGVGERAR